MSVIEKNSEILFLYDAKMCNPNGDPDDENRPRMDYDRERCLVSDVRLKRYLRDYLEEMGHTIYVTKSAGVVQAMGRIQEVLGKEKVSGDDLPELLEKLLDARLFGATMPIKGERRGGGEAVNLTGPVQFTWGYSLNKVQPVDSSTISSQFATRKKPARALSARTIASTMPSRLSRRRQRQASPKHARAQRQPPAKRNQRRRPCTDGRGDDLRHPLAGYPLQDRPVSAPLCSFRL